MKAITKGLLCAVVFGMVFSLTFNYFYSSSPTIVIASDDKEFREDVKYSIKLIENSKSAGHLIKDLQKTGKTVFIVKGKRSFCGVEKSDSTNVKNGVPLNSTIYLGNEDNSESPLYIILAHELQHALDLAQGKFILDTSKARPGVSRLEASAMDLENAMQREFGYPVRERHDH